MPDDADTGSRPHERVERKPSQGGLRLNESGRLGGPRRGGEDGALVGFQGIEPIRDVMRVVGTRLRGKLEFCAEEGAGQLGNELFEGVFGRPEAVAKLAVETVLGAGMMAKFMEEDGVVGFGPTPVGTVDEKALVGHLDVIAGQPVVGSLAAVADVGAGGSDHCVRAGVPLDGTEVLRRGRELEAFDLAHVEDAAGLGDPALAVVIVGLGLNLKFLVEDDDRALGALLNLRTDLLPLLVGGPEIVGEAGKLRLGP